MNVDSARVLLHFRRPLIAALHAGLIAAAWMGSFALRFDFDPPVEFVDAMWSTFPVVLAAKLGTFYAFGLFHGWWKYAGLSDLIDITKAAFTSVVIIALIVAALGGFRDFPRSVMLLDLGLTVMLVGGVRFAVRAYTEMFGSSAVNTPLRRVLIAGAGRTGTTLAREMRSNTALRFEPVAFVDDDPNKQGLRLHGIAVRGTTADIPALVRRFSIDEVVLAMPAAPGRVIKRIIDTSRDAGVTFKTMPDVGDLIDGRISVTRIREVRIGDLLGREAVQGDASRVEANNAARTILVTGATGSIGAELARQVAALRPSRLVILDRSESDLHDLELSLRELHPALPITAVVGDILDAAELRETFERTRPERVYHAAAYKHVALMERHVVGAVRNNVLGTYQVAAMADQYGVEQFVMISTDKAVRPTSLMGATKRAAERVLQQFAGSRTRFMVVRFGNVLGSRGSVVPIFTRQIANGGPVTVTHPDVVRYFMTISEAVHLVLEASAMGESGTVFHLDMGEPVKIADLAANMIRLSGLEPGRDIEIRFVGLRPGEKLYEELLIDGESVVPTPHPRIRSVKAVDAPLPGGWVDELVRLTIARDVPRILTHLHNAVPDYTPSDLVQAYRSAALTEP